MKCIEFVRAKFATAKFDLGIAICHTVFDEFHISGNSIVEFEITSQRSRISEFVDGAGIAPTIYVLKLGDGFVEWAEHIGGSAGNGVGTSGAAWGDAVAGLAGDGNFEGGNCAAAATGNNCSFDPLPIFLSHAQNGDVQNVV